MPYEDAVIQMELSPKRKAADMIKFLLHAARGNAVHQWQADVSRLRVQTVMVDKGQFAARLRRHGRGRMGRMHRPQSHLTIKLEEVPPGLPLKKSNASTARRRALANAGM